MEGYSGVTPSSKVVDSKSPVSIRRRETFPVKSVNLYLNLHSLYGSDGTISPGRGETLPGQDPTEPGGRS